jgi:regulator of RNase E activity RraA
MTDQAALRRLVTRLTTSTAADILKPHAPELLMMRGVRPMWPAGGVQFGPARTLRHLPARANLAAGPNGNARTSVMDTLRPGDILVIDAMRGGGPAIGDLTGMRAMRAGAAAVVTDGTVRDVPEVARLGLPLFAAGTCFALPRALDLAWEYDTPIQCGGALVLPGDWVLADAEGAMVIPAALLGALEAGAETLLTEEAFSRALLDRGHLLGESYPIPARLRPAFERWRRDGVLPDAAEIRGRAE